MSNILLRPSCTGEAPAGGPRFGSLPDCRKRSCCCLWLSDICILDLQQCLAVLGLNLQQEHGERWLLQSNAESQCAARGSGCFVARGAALRLSATNQEQWDYHTGGPIFGTVERFEVCCIKVAEAQRFGFNEAPRLMATGRATRRPFWAKPVLRRFSGPRIESVAGSCFVDDFVSCWGSRVHIGCLNPVEDYFVWWLDCLLLKEGASAFCSLRSLLEVSCCCGVCGFPVVGFHVNDCIEYIIAPCSPLHSYRSFQSRKCKTGWSMNLLRERCGKVKYWRLSYSAIVSIACQLGDLVA